MSQEDLFQRSLIVHQQLRGKISVHSKLPISGRDDLSLSYTPGVARPCEVIAEDASQAHGLTIKNNTVAVVSDGSAVLGLGNIGPYAAIPVMEGKALLFKEYGGIDAWPICLDTQDESEIIETVRRIAPVFGGINLEDISAPRCFAIEDALQDLGIPVFHDDQHGTAIVLLAALLNASKVVGKPLVDMKVVINGAGAAGTAIAKLLRCVGQDENVCEPVRDIVICDSKGIIDRERTDLNAMKKSLLGFTNVAQQSGTLADALVGADAFVGVSRGNVIDASNVQSMNDGAIIFAMANPEPEIMPDIARSAGAAVVGTGRSDFPNQVNNLLAFPGIFRGALDARCPQITPEMKIAAAHALARAVENPTAEQVIPDPLDRTVAPLVACAVAKASPSN